MQRTSPHPGLATPCGSRAECERALIICTSARRANILDMVEFRHGPEQDPGGAVAYFGEAVGPHIAGARTAIRRADRRLHTLASLAETPDSPRWQVEQDLAEYLIWARQVRVSLNNAVDSSGDATANDWWKALAADNELQAFTGHRDAALKRVERVGGPTSIDAQYEGRPQQIIYWAFSADPHVGHPLIPRCQKHLERLRDLLEELSRLLPPAPPESF